MTKVIQNWEAEETVHGTLTLRQEVIFLELSF